MQVDYLLIGQGISGTFLSHYLLKAGKSVLVIDEPQPWSPSRVAAGIMNPVTGRRLSTVWKAKEIFDFIPDAYTEIGQLLNIEAFSRKDVLDFFPNPFMRESFLGKIAEDDQFVALGTTPDQWNPFLQFEFGYGQIKPVYTAHLDLLIPAWRQLLISQNQLREEYFDLVDLKLEKEGIVYNDITAKKIIFCEGPAGMENPWFKMLPFSKNKGQALILHIPVLPGDYIYKKGMLLVPLPEQQLFWLGASYEWEFTDTLPTTQFRDKMIAALKEWIKIPFEIVEQRAGLRPATLERRPFCGLHPIHPAVGIFNGMGTKGCSLAPYFANELANHLTSGSSITPEADVTRFKRILST
ncbi:MAG: NAD(P)/FAD-dependent oxidoreductase [Chitinophagaceae bacterium]